MESDFDPERAWLRGTDLFQRFEVTDDGAPLVEIGLADDDELIIAERGGIARGFLARELARPHMAQGQLGAEPYLVSF